MNYFSHGFRFVGRPWFLAGTAVPDWLATADRKTRVRPHLVKPLAGDEVTPVAELARGVLKHLRDDRWFHKNPAFVEISAALTELLREAVGRGTRHRLGFVGHIATETLLDSVLIDDDPGLLDAYYDELATLDCEVLEEAVNRMAQGSTNRLAPFVRRFHEAEFLRDYGDEPALLKRLNQVLCRIGLGEIPGEAERALRAGRIAVRERKLELLPPEAL